MRVRHKPWWRWPFFSSYNVIDVSDPCDWCGVVLGPSSPGAVVTTFRDAPDQKYQWHDFCSIECRDKFYEDRYGEKVPYK